MPLNNSSGGGGGGGGGSGVQVTKLNKRVEELKTKLITKTDELNDALKSKAEVCVHLYCHCVVLAIHCLQLSTQIVEYTHQLKDRDDKISALNTQ